MMKKQLYLLSALCLITGHALAVTSADLDVLPPAEQTRVDKVRSEFSKLPIETMSEADFVKEAEKYFYDIPARGFELEHLSAFLEKRHKLFPKEAYPIWARARVPFFRKERLFVKERAGVKDIDFHDAKIKLGEDCQRWGKMCIDAHSKVAECHLMMGACYAMEASTFGVSLRSIPKIRGMYFSWEKAMEIPSNFKHVGGTSTSEMAKALMGTLLRVIPDSFLFKLFVGVRGNKDKSYEYLSSVVRGKLEGEPLFVVEVAATALCIGQRKKSKAITDEGLQWIEIGLKNPPRHYLDEYDQQNLRYLKTQVAESCNYRREKFEDTEKDFEKMRSQTKN